MATLTAKRSNQSLFLRILKVILQLRDAAKKVAKKPQGASGTNRPRGRRTNDFLQKLKDVNIEE